MKRALGSGDEITKKTKLSVEEVEGGGENVFVNLGDDLLFEVLKHVDARTLASASCVSKKWRNTAHDERLWEMICTRHWANIGCGSDQLRTVVLALGGFRRLHALWLWPLFKSFPSSLPSSSSSSSHSLSTSSFSSKKAHRRWGKDELHLLLSLQSIRYYEKMNFNNKG